MTDKPVPIAEQLEVLRGMVDDYTGGHTVSWDDADCEAMRAVLRTLEERRGFETWCEGAAITLQRAADILCDLGTEEADEVYAQAYTALNLCPVDIPTPPAGDRDAR